MLSAVASQCLNMTLLNRLNGLTAYKAIGELEEGAEYKILKVKLKNAEYGQSLQAIIEKEEGELIRTFLPKRYRECFTDEEIEQDDGLLKMKYGGKCKNRYIISFSK